jgi:hypothetical protein
MGLSGIKNLKENDLLIDMDELVIKIEKFDMDILSKRSPHVFNEHIYEKLDQLRSNHKNDTTSISIKDIKLVSNILKIAQIFAKKTIQTNDFTYFYPVASIIGYLQQEPEFLSHILDDSDFNKLKKLVFELFCLTKQDYYLPDSANHFEKVSFERYNNGIKENNLKNVFDFIEALERGNGYSMNFFMGFLSRLLLLDFNNYISFLDSLEEPLLMSKHIEILKRETKKESVVDALSESKNKWLLFEYLRQIFRSYNVIVCDDKEMRIISHLFKIIYNINKNFFIEGISFLSHPNNYKCLGTALGFSLSAINNKVLLNEIIDYMGIDKFANSANFWLHIGKSIIDDDNKTLCRYMASTVFHKWSIFLEELFYGDELLIMMALTDYEHIIDYYFQELLFNNKSEFLAILKEKVDLIVNYKSYWVKYPSRKRLIWLGYIYLMSTAWKKIVNDKIDEDFEQDILFIVNDSRLIVDIPDRNHGIHENITKMKDNFGL